MIEARHKRTNSINFYERHEAQNQLPQNLRFKLEMNHWPICFEQSQAHAIHLQELAILNEALTRIAKNRKEVLMLDLESIVNRLAGLSDPTYLEDHLTLDRPTLEESPTYLETISAKFAAFIQNFDRQKHKLQFRNSEDIDLEESTTNLDESTNTSTDPSTLLIPYTPTTAVNPTSQNKKQRKLKGTLVITQKENNDIIDNPTIDSCIEIQSKPAIPVTQKNEISTEDKLNTITTQLQSLTSTMTQYQQSQQQHPVNRPFRKTPFSYAQPKNQYPNHQNPNPVQQQRYGQGVQGATYWPEHSNTGMTPPHPASFNDTQHIEYSNSSNGQYRQANHNQTFLPHPPNTPSYYQNNKRPY